MFQDRLSGMSSRGRRLLLGMAALFAGRGSSTVLTLSTTALVARSLSRPEFGFWVVLTGLPTLIALFDLGIGNALRNKLTVLAAQQGGDAAARVHFFSSLFMFLSAALVLSALSTLVVPFLPWRRMLSAEISHLIPVAPWLTAAAAAALFLSLAVSLGSFGFYAYQETHLNAALDTFRAFCIFLFTALAAAVGGGPSLTVGAYFAGFLLGSVVSLLYFLRRRGWSWSPPAREEVRSVWRDLRGDSSLFFLLQMSAGLIIYTDSLLVARAAGFGQAGDYALVQKIFLYLIAVQFMGLVPLWTAFTDAHARGDHAWVRRMFRRSFWMTLLVTGAGSVVMAVLGPFLVKVWTGKVVADRILFPVMALWAVLYGWCNCFSVPLNALGMLKRQAPVSFAAAVINIPLCLWWGKLWGPVGICWAAVAVMAPVAVSNTVEVRGLLRSHA
jgi:O-antigen/teichoic acid export membrane protein